MHSGEVRKRRKLRMAAWVMGERVRMWFLAGKAEAVGLGVEVPEVS